MNASSHSCSILLLAHLFIFSIYAQDTADGFSESKPYSPRQFAGQAPKSVRPKDEGEKKSAQAEADQMLEFSVSVIDKGGRFVTGLRRGDFSVFLDEKETEILAFVPGGERVNVIFLVDTSPSVTLDLKDISKLTQSLVDQIPSHIKIMIVQFGHKMKVVTPLTDDRAAVSKGVKNLKIISGTSIYDTIGELFGKELPDLPGRNWIILISDGIDTLSKKFDYPQSLLEVEKRDASLFAIYHDPMDYVAFGNQKSKKTGLVIRSVGGIPVYRDLSTIQEEEYVRGRWYLNDLVDISGGRIISIITSEKPPDPAPIDGLMRELSLRYLVRVALPKDSTPGRRHSIRVRVNRPGVNVISRGSYMPRE